MPKSSVQIASPRRLRRGAVPAKTPRVFIGGFFPDALVAMIDKAVADSDLDRSKFLRSAAKEKLNSMGITASDFAHLN